MARRFRGVLPGILGAVLVSCSAPPTEDAPATADGSAAEDYGPVIRAHAAFTQALQDGDAAAVAGYLDRSPEFLIFHPVTTSRIRDVDKAAQGFEKMVRELGSAEWTEVHTQLSRHGDVAWVTSHLLLEAPSLSEPVLARATEIWIRRGDAWKLVHGHWSDEPGGA